MVKNALWGTLGVALPLLLLGLVRHLGWSPPVLPLGWATVWFGGFVFLILLIRLMDVLLKTLFTRRPWTERFATGILIGCWIFAGLFLHE
ncbi:MAG: hypothetical protein NVSMB31_06760 [Vulcanimicrobiaceae bacterium]